MSGKRDRLAAWDALDRESHAVAAAAPADVLAALVRSGKALARFVAAGQLSPHLVINALTDAARSAGSSDHASIDGAIRDGLAQGEADGTPIRIIQGALPDAVDEAEAALVAAGAGPIFQRGHQLVHIATCPARRIDRPIRKPNGTLARSAPEIELQEAIAPIQPAALLEQLARAASFEKFDARLDDWRAIDPPRKLADAYMSRARWNLLDLRQLIGTPTLRADGSLLSKRGYDYATGLYLLDELPGLNVPDRPTPQQAERANEILTDVLKSFPLVDKGPPGVSLAVLTAGVLGAILRPTLPAAPLIAITAPKAGTGKSYAVEVTSMIATGRRAVAVATGSGPEEFEKSLGAALINGRPLLLLDNLVQPLGGQLLCMVLTQECVDIRLLGQTRTVDVPTATAVFATGNNLKLRGDLTRRALLCRMDTGSEHPEERPFETDLLAEVEARRGELVSAALTIARWYQTNGNPAPLSGRRFASFETWCSRVRDPLLALGHADPVASLDEARASDPESERLTAVVQTWAEVIGVAVPNSDGDQPVATCAEAVRTAQETGPMGGLVHQEFYDALQVVAGEGGKGLNAWRLGRFLSRCEDVPMAGHAFRRDRQPHRVVRWKLERLV